MNNSEAIEFAVRSHAQHARGWNTWDTRSVLRHVLLPESLAISLGFAALDKLVWLNDAHFGSQSAGRTAGTKLTSTDKQLPVGNTIDVCPDAHAYDGSYTQLEVNLRGSKFKVETAATGDEWIAVVTPLEPSQWMQILTVHVSILWGKEGVTSKTAQGVLDAALPGRKISIHVTGTTVDEPNLPVHSPYIAVRLDRPVVISTHRPTDLGKAAAIISRACAKEAATHDRYGDLRESHQAMQACLAWNIIYEPRFCRVIACVARDWNCWRGGYAVFCWDSFFMAWMMSLDAPDLAYGCYMETLRETVNDTFVSNVAQGTGRIACDRSQPPVGSMSLLAMHRQSPNVAAVKAAYPALLAWNRWWDESRRNAVGSLSLGSHPYPPRVGDPAEFVQPNTAAGAALESGLDNSPIYDNSPFDPSTHLMLVEDVGLNSLYVVDCEMLAELAVIAGRAEDAAELKHRRGKYLAPLRKLWSEDAGTFLNRRLDSDSFLEKQSLTSFYPLMTGVVGSSQAERMMREHLLNPARYDGEWMPPVTPRDDPSFPDQLYQRGRIWPPSTFLVWLGLQRCNLAARHHVAERSIRLLIDNWRSERVVAENYSGIDGRGGRTPHSHPLYGWSGLLAMMSLIEQGLAASPMPIEDA